MSVDVAALRVRRAAYRAGLSVPISMEERNALVAVADAARASIAEDDGDHYRVGDVCRIHPEQPWPCAHARLKAVLAALDFGGES